MKKIITVSIIGVGARGGETYGRYMNLQKDKYKITNLCDINAERLNKYGKLFNVPEKNRFISATEFFNEKRSELLIISTLDKIHVEIAEKALKRGYHILLEKPISDNIQDLKNLLEESKKHNEKIMVCHVLRYTVMIEKIKKLLEDGVIGKLITVDHTENVGFWHAAHSYVRGNWRRAEETSPMIMAKCCHDFDLLQYFIGDECESVSSYGDTNFFNKENKPEDTADRCVECKLIDACPYSAKKIYLDMWKSFGSSENIWPMNVITDKLPLTEESIYTTIKNGQYGRCVFNCDNDVVDNQTVIMKFKNNVTATLKMEAFTKSGGRIIRFFGSKGEIYFDEGKQIIEVRKFYGDDIKFMLPDLTDDLSGHGGGDNRMINKLYDVLTGNISDIDTSLKNSIESHLMAIAAEKSRVKGGERILVDSLR